MALNAKQQKKFKRWQNETEKRTTTIITDIVLQYFVIFTLSLLWDRIAECLHLRHDDGIGAMQVVICIICIAQMIRYYRVTR